MAVTHVPINFFNNFSNFNNLFSNREKRINFFSSIEPLLTPNDLDLATRHRDKHLAIVLWIGRNHYKMKKKTKEKILSNLISKDISSPLYNLNPNIDRFTYNTEDIIINNTSPHENVARLKCVTGYAEYIVLEYNCKCQFAWLS